MAYQKKVVKRIAREARRRYGQGGYSKAERRKIRSAYQTGIVESGLRNVAYGDSDSLGWRQERASLYPDPMNLKASVRRYFDEADRLYRGQSAGALSADVQRPAAQYRGRYAQHRGEGVRLLRKNVLGKSVRTNNPGRTRTVSKTFEGVDRSPERKALYRQYFSERGRPGALIDLKVGLAGAQDTPDRTVTKKVKAKQPKRARVKAGKSDIVSIGRFAQSMGLRVSEHPAFDKVDPVHTTGSYHYRNAAIDVSGSPEQMAKFAAAVRKRWGRDVEELIWRGPNPRTRKHGKHVPTGFYTGHTDHVHVADDD